MPRIETLKGDANNRVVRKVNRSAVMFVKSRPPNTVWPLPLNAVNAFLVPSQSDNWYWISVLVVTQNSLFFLKPLSVISDCDFPSVISSGVSLTPAGVGDAAGCARPQAPGCML